jgi:hypothetical protein
LRAIFPSELTVLDFITRTTSREGRNLWSSSVCSFLQSLVTSLEAHTYFSTSSSWTIPVYVFVLMLEATFHNHIKPQAKLKFWRNEPRFQACAATLMRSALFWGITRRHMVFVCRRFGTTCRSHLQGSRARVFFFSDCWPSSVETKLNLRLCETNVNCDSIKGFTCLLHCTYSCDWFEYRCVVWEIFFSFDIVIGNILKTERVSIPNYKAQNLKQI